MVGGAQISGVLSPRTGGPGSSAKSSIFLEEKPPSVVESYKTRGRLSWRSLSFIQAVADSREITPYLWEHPDEDGEEMAQPRGKLGDAAGPCQVSNAVPLSTNPSAQSNFIT